MFQLDQNGQLPPNTQIWYNDELTPAGTAYKVSILAAGGGLVYGPQFFILAGASPSSVDNMFPSTIGGSVPVFSTAILANPTTTQSINTQGLSFQNGGLVTGFSDAGLTVKWQLNNATGAMDVYNGVSGVGNKVNYTVAQDDRTAQNATVGPITLVTGTATTGGHYWVLGFIECTTSDASGATVVFSETHTSDGLSVTVSSNALSLASTTNTNQRMQSFVNVDANANITYTATVTGVPTTAKYSIHVSVVKL